MNQPGDDDRDRGPTSLRVAGVGLGLLGATFGGVAGWFTLAPTAAAVSTHLVATRTGSNTVGTDGATLRLGSGRPHTRTGGS
ncbi:MAG: hypothetical protein LCH96_08635 [Actinobacteria bacterium]|nr:hypothetical protein [Actinomycetota bacterium]